MACLIFLVINSWSSLYSFKLLIKMPYIVFKDYPKKKYKCSVRLLRICSDNHIQKLADFAEMTFNDVVLLPECGPITARHVKKILTDNGLKFRRKHGFRRIKEGPDCQQCSTVNFVSEGL